MKEPHVQAKYEGRSRRSGPRLPAVGIAVALALAVSLGAAACSLGNVHHDDCTTSDQCAAAFGAGSACDKGFCTAPTTNPSCQGKDAEGHICFNASAACVPKSASDFENGCTAAQCLVFDRARLTKLTDDGGLPPLP